MNRKIDQVEQTLNRDDLSENDVQYYREEKKQLREEKKQLREKELILLRQKEGKEVLETDLIPTQDVACVSGSFSDCFISSTGRPKKHQRRYGDERDVKRFKGEQFIITLALVYCPSRSWCC